MMVGRLAEGRSAYREELIRLVVREMTEEVDAEAYFPEPDMLGSAAYTARMHFGIHKHVHELYGDR